MPYTLPSGFATHLASGSTTLAVALRIVRRDGTVFGVTNLMMPVTIPSLTVGGITVPSTTYQPGMIPTNLEESDDLKADNFEFSGPLGAIADTDVRGGKFARAQFTLIIFNYLTLTHQMLRKRGHVAFATVTGNKWTFSCKSLSHLLDSEVIEQTSPLCRVRRFGDTRCGKALGGTTVDGYNIQAAVTVTAITDAVRKFTCSGLTSYPVGRFNKGVVTFTGGLNNGEEMEILKHEAGGLLTLRWDLPFAVSNGDALTATLGCDRRMETCWGKYNNALRFDGEESVPTIEQVSEVK